MEFLELSRHHAPQVGEVMVEPRVVAAQEGVVAPEQGMRHHFGDDMQVRAGSEVFDRHDQSQSAF